MQTPRARRWPLALLAVALIAGPAFARDKEPGSPTKLASVEGITEYRLDNGLRLLLFPDDSKPRVTVALTVFVGSRHEGYGETGMAHLLEHMVFKGTPTHPRVDKVLRERGASYNGTTNSDRTNYFETLPAGDDNLEFAIRFEADRLVNSFIKREDLNSEMTVVRNEFEQGENNPQRILSQKVMATAFEWHNYGKSTIGNRSDIERVPIENLQAFYKKHYQPDNAMVVVAGQFDEKKALEYARKYFGTIPKPERKLDKTYTEEPPQDGERVVTLKRVGGVGLVGMAYHIPPGPHADMPALQILASVLSSQPTGRLYKALVETKKATSAGAFAQGMHDPGVMMVSATVADKATHDAVRDEITRVLGEVANKGVTREEVERAIRQSTTLREREATDTSRLAVSLSGWAAQGDWRLYFLHRDRIEKVTPEDVKAVAAKYLRNNNRTVGYYVPTEKPERVAVAGRPDVDALVKDYKGRDLVAAGEAFDLGWDNIAKRTTTETLPSGVKVALLPKKTKGETVSLSLTLRFGDGESLKDYRTAAGFLANLMERGTKKHTFAELREELTKQKASINLSGGPGSLHATIQTRRENLPAVLGLLREMLREPALKPEEFELLKKQQLAGLEQQLKDPVTLAQLKLARELEPRDKGDLRYVMTVEESIEAVKAVSLDKVEKLYAEFLNGQHGEAAVVGDFDKDQCVKLLTAALDGWKSSKPYVRIPNDVPAGIKPGKHVIRTPDKANASFQSGLAFPMKQDHEDYPALVLANYILGSGPGSRLWDRVREKEGLSYGVGSTFTASALDDDARMAFRAICNPENAGKVEKAILSEVERMRADGVLKEELEKARESYLRASKNSRADDGRLAGTLAADLHASKKAADRIAFEKKVAALTPEQVTTAFKKYADQAKLVIVVGGDLP